MEGTEPGWDVWCSPWRTEETQENRTFKSSLRENLGLKMNCDNDRKQHEVFNPMKKWVADMENKKTKCISWGRLNSQLVFFSPFDLTAHLTNITQTYRHLNTWQSTRNPFCGRRFHLPAWHYLVWLGTSARGYAFPLQQGCRLEVPLTDDVLGLCSGHRSCCKYSSSPQKGGYFVI